MTPRACGLLVGLLLASGTFLMLSASRGHTLPALHRRVLPYLGAGTAHAPLPGRASSPRGDLVAALRGRRCERRVREELPVLLELLWLAVVAGEGMPEALRRAAGTGSGPVATALRRTLSDGRPDGSAAAALRDAARLIASPTAARFLGTMAAALTGGAAPEDTLRALLREARHHAAGSVTRCRTPADPL